MRVLNHPKLWYSKVKISTNTTRPFWAVLLRGSTFYTPWFVLFAWHSNSAKGNWEPKTSMTQCDHSFDLIKIHHSTDLTDRLTFTFITWSSSAFPSSFWDNSTSILPDLLGSCWLLKENVVVLVTAWSPWIVFLYKKAHYIETLQYLILRSPFKLPQRPSAT